MKVTCQVLMNSSDKVVELTGKSESQWADCVIETSFVQAVRRSIAEEDGKYADLDVLHFDGDYWITDIDYDVFVAEHFNTVIK